MLENLENKSGNRRDFLKKTGKQALWMAPTLTVLMTASSQPAKATNNTSGGYTYNHDQKLKTILKKFFGWLKSKKH
jgi:hypothetical protein